MNTHRLATAAVAALLLGGCATPSTPSPPQAPVAAQFGRGAASLNAPAVPMAPAAIQPADADQRWWNAYGDPDLDALIGSVLERSPDLAAAGFKLAHAVLAAGLALDDMLPHASASATIAQSRAVDRGDRWARSSGAKLTVDYELDLFGRLRAQRSAAEWSAVASEQDLASTRLALIASASSLYWSIGYLNQSIAAGEASLARLERTLELVRVQVDAGAASLLELREAEQTLAAQRQRQSVLVQQRVEARNSLTVLLDGAPWPETREPRQLSQGAVPQVRAGVPAELLARRPDLRASVARLSGAMADERATVRSYFPQLTLTGALGTASTSLADVLKNPVATLGAGLTLPFLNWNQARLQRASSHIEVQSAINDYRKALYTAFAEVDDALSDSAELQRQLEAARESFEAAAQVEQLYEVRYRSGATSLRFWLDAQQTRRDAELALAQVRLDALNNSATLFQALGGS